MSIFDVFFVEYLKNSRQVFCLLFVTKFKREEIKVASKETISIFYSVYTQKDVDKTFETRI